MIAKLVYFEQNFPNFQERAKNNIAIWLDFPEFSGKAKDDVHIWLEFPKYLGKGNWKCNQTPLFTWKIPNIWDFPYINVAKTDYTLGQFKNKIDEFILNFAIRYIKIS